MEYELNLFEEVLAEITYAFEINGHNELWSDADGRSYFSVHKLTICSDGRIHYKGNIITYDLKLWPRIELLAKVITGDSTVRLLYERS